MTTPTDLEALAAKLTKAQREAVTSCFQDPPRHAPYHVFRNTRTNRKAWRDLIPLGLVSGDVEGFDLVARRGSPLAMVGLSPLGLSLRTHLERTTDEK